MTNDTSFGAWLRQLRRAHDLTQEALADQAGCAVDTLRAVESGRRRPSRELAAILAERLGLPEAERAAFISLARGEAPPTAHPPPAPAPAPGPPGLPHAPLIGREAEIAALSERLDSPDCRLLTLVGPGGIGKTTLASHIAAAWSVRLPGGVVGAGLAGAADPPAALATIAQALGLRLSVDGVAAQIAAALAPRRLLLLLDNLEHLLADSALTDLIQDILAQAPRVRILATSRQPLRLRAEWVVELGGLGLPPAEADGPADHSDATLLFVERARRLRHNFALTPNNRAAVARICRLVGGAPLAIELAAAWTPVMPCAEIAQELARSLDLLVSEERDVPERHRSIKAVFTSSWQLLRPEEQQALARLAVFRGGFTREAAEFVAETRLPQLNALVQASLLRRDGQRYAVHELVRQYAAERLRGSPDEAPTRRRFLDFFLARASEASHGFATLGDRRGYDALGPEIDNLRAALQQAIAGGQAELGARLNTGLRIFWALNSLYREGVAWSERLLEARELSDADRGDQLNSISYLGRSLGTIERARSAAEGAIEAYRRAGEPEGLAWAVYNLAQLLLTTGDYPRARELHRECVALRRAASGPHTLAWGLIMLMTAELLLGERAAAERLYAEALGLARGIEDRFTEGGAHNYYSLGMTLLGERAGGPAAALAHGLLSDPAYPWGLIIALEVLAAQAGMRGQRPAAACLAAAAARLRAQHQISATAIFHADYGRLAALARGPLDDAAWAALLAHDDIPLAAAVALACAKA